MASPQTWTDPNTGDVYELVPDAPAVQAPKTWTDPNSGDTYELIPDTAAPAAPKTVTLEAPAEQTVASVAFKNNPQAAAAAQSLWDAGVRDPAAFNTALASKFPQFSNKVVTVADIAAARKRDAWYKARGQKNPGNFLFTESTGIADPEAPDNVFSAAIQGGAKSLESMANSATGVAALAADVVGADQTSDYLLNKYIEDQQKIQFNNPSAVETVQDIGGIGDAAMYAAETIGGLVPQITASMGAGSIGSAVGRKAAEKFAVDQAKGRIAGTAAGVLSSTASQETGLIYGDTYRETGVKAPVSSVIAGLAAGGLDAIAPFRALRRIGVPAEVITDKLASRMVKTGAKDMFVEGGTEAAQTFIESLPEAVITGKSPFTEEMLDRMIDSFARGAISGGVLGAGSEVLRPNAQPVAEETPQAQPEAVPAEAPAPAEETDAPLPFEAPDFLQTPVKGPFKQTPAFLGESAKPKGRAKPVETAAPVAPTAAPLAVNKQQASDHINNVIASDWKNAPPITTVESLDELPEDVRQNVINDGAQDAKGITVDGQVYILAHNLKDLDDLAGVTYHEALGHAGLGMQFGKRLNAVLEQMYNTNQMVREAADAWLAKNSTQAESPTAHAVEEILAETSEGGKVDAKVMDKIKAFLKQYARRVPGLKNLKYTDKEVIAILSMANNKVISGKSSATSGNGNRYMYIGARGVSERAEYNQEREDNYYEAMDLAEQGYDPKPGGTIHQETGWFFGPDRRWRTEISDAKASFKEGVDNTDFDRSATKKKVQEKFEQAYKVAGKQAATYEDKIRYKKALTLLPKYFERITDRLPETARDIWKNPPAGLEGIVETITRNIRQNNLEQELLSYTKLGDVLDHPELFNVYPKARDINIAHVNFLLSAQGYKGFFRESENLLALNRDKDNLSTALHEIQHWVQSYEGFAKGGSDKTALYSFEMPKLKNLYGKVVKYNNKLISHLQMKYDAIESMLSNDNILNIFNLQEEKQSVEFGTRRSVAINDEINQQFEEFYNSLGVTTEEAKKNFNPEYLKIQWMVRRGENQIEEELDKLAAEVLKIAETNTELKAAMESNSKTDLVKALSKNKDLSFQAYEHLFGEVEARDVQARQKMNNAQRSRVTPYTLEEHIEPNDYAITFDLGGSSNKYSKPDNSDRPRGLRPDKIVGKKKSFYEPFLKQLEEDGAPRTVQTWEETEELAKDIGMNVDKVMKLNRGPKAEEYTAGVNFMMGRLNLIGDLSEKVSNGTATDRDKDKLSIYLRQFADMYDVLSETKTTLARTMNIMKRIVDNQQAAANNLRYMLTAESQSLLDDPNKVKQLADKINELKGNPSAQAKAAKLMLDPRFEDYVQDVWFNSVLSNPITHKINVLGSVGNFLTDLAEHGFASALGQVRRGDPKADRVLAREVLWRFYGAAMGLKGAFGKSLQAFKAGEPVTKIGALERSHNLVKNKWGTMLEGPSKMLAAEDEFMRNIIQTSSYYGMALRTAANEGLRGSALFTRAHQLVANPTDEMILTAADYTRALQFVDKPSKPARTYLTLMSRNPNDGITARSAKFLGSLFTPFIPTADSIFRSAVRRSPLGGLDRYNQADFKAGGSRKDVATSRVVMGSMLAMWVANEVLKGTISGNGPDDYRRRAELEAGGWRANSIKMGDQWVPFDGLDPLAMNLSIVANAVEDYKERKVDDKGYTDQATAAVGGIVRALGTSSWLKSLAFITEGINDARTGQQAIENLGLNTATGLVPYSGMGRFMGSMRDPVERDVSADGTMAERFTDRVKSITPFLKSSLPARNDVYGRERVLENREGLGWLGRHPQSTIDKTPVVVELQRLADISGKTLIPPVGKDDAKKWGIERLNSRQFQQYQDYAGDLILAASKEAIEDPSWNTLTDEEKVEEIKVIAKDMRAMAREDIFGPLPEDEEEGQTEDGFND